MLRRMDLIGKIPKISICIPTYEMKGLGATFLFVNLSKILSQTYDNYDVIISDHSKDDSILSICNEFADKGVDITYIRNSSMIGNSSANMNEAIKYAKGDIIKIIFQDDFLYHDDSLKDIADCFIENPHIKWLATSCCHTKNGSEYDNFMDPEYTDNILTGNNRISSPSVISFVNEEDKLYFDPDFIWLMDCDYYYRLMLKYGSPHYLKKTNVVNRHWDGQLTKILSHDDMQKEHLKILQKHNQDLN
jgi:glycosyltransferase involved in cell wall biosynthesis